MRHTPALALGLVLAAGTAASAQAEPWPARLFMLHHAEQPLVRDVAETSMGRVVVATGDYPAQVADIRLLTSRGRLRALSRHGDADPIDGGSGIGIGGDGAGRVLVMEGMNAQLMRTALSGASTLLAGTGVPGFSGDGGPGVLAQLDPRGALAGGVTQLGDGSVVFTDAGNNRLRRIRADGTIETYAGSGPGVSANTIGCGPVG